MSLFGRKEKEEIERLKNQMRPEQVTLADLQGQIETQQARLAALQKQVQAKEAELDQLSQQLIQTDNAILFQSFGLYTPHYDLVNAEAYKERLTEIRNRQKNMIKNKRAVTGNNNWTVNGSASQGKKMLADMQKLLLRAFNSECDDVVEHVRYSNIEASAKRIATSREAISKLGQIMAVGITQPYFEAKMDELYLAFEYQQKKQQEKEAQKEARARMREEAKLAKELEEARRKLEKEQSHYQNALAKLSAQIAAGGADQEALLAKKAELEQQLEKIAREFHEVDYREANQRAGYVYVISNIGAFGENVYKIGMTRRLDPMDRVDELGDASVPFDFDVHAMIFTEDAPGLEAALHNAFADRKVNFVNQRREFFRVTLDEIKQVVRDNFDQTVEFIDIAPAEQYRQSLLMQQEQ